MIHCYDLEVKHGASLISIPGLLAADCGNVQSGDMGNWTDADTSIQNLASCRTDCSNPDADLSTGFDAVIGEGVAINYNPVLGWVGSLNDVEPLKGYWLKMDLRDNQGNESPPCTIEVCVVPENPLDSGELYMSWDNFGFGGEFFTSPDQWCEVYGECPDMSGCPDGEECLPSDYIDPDDCPDGECPELPILGCTDDGTNNPYGDYEACNYNSDADTDDGSCIYTTDTPGLGAEMGEGPFACDGFEGAGSTCLGFLDPDVLHVYPQGNPNQGQQCDGSCGKADDPNPNKIKILDCNGTCISLNIWLNYVQTDPYGEPGVCMDYQAPNANFACTSATQVDGEEFYFNCSLGNCEDNCGACLGTNECGDCNGVPNGASQLDGYPLSETTELSVGTVNTGCCPTDTRIKYYLDLDGDGLGEDTPTNESPTFQGYLLCPDNPNLSDHCYSPTNDVGCGAFDNLTDCENAGCTFGTPFVSNQLDNCPNGGYIDICGNCTTDADYPGTAVCGGCLNSDACNYDAGAIWDDGSCYYTYQNNSLYCNCDSDSTPENLYGSSFFNCDGVCTTITDCAGVCGGGTVEDCLGECGGNATICTDTDACNTGICATCEYPIDNYDCYGNCLNDSDGDGICDEDEVDGCTDIDACNYNSSATDDDGSCTYPEQYYDCEGNCLNDVDGDGICDEVDGGCTDYSACNYNSGAQYDDGSCTFAELFYDCNGDCCTDTPDTGTAENTQVICPNGELPIDCTGECNGDSVVDDCGICNGSNYFDENGVLPNGDCDCFDNVDLGCGCGDPAANACGDCGNVIVDEGCGCGNGPPTGCDNVCGSTAVEDDCGECGGDGPPTNYDCEGNCIAVVDCAGVCGGTSEIDECDECTGDADYQAESCYGCTYPGADNYDENATIDNRTCTFTFRAEPVDLELRNKFTSTATDGSTPFKGEFDFYYPYEKSISVKDIYNYIWLVDPDTYCENQLGADWEWDGCDMSEAPSLGSLGAIFNGDQMETTSLGGMQKSMAYFEPEGFVFDSTDDLGEEEFGNALYETGNSMPDGCTESDGSCIVDGFIGKIRFRTDDQFSGCTVGACTGDCDDGIFSIDGSGRQCDCGVRAEMISCGRPFGWLKFNEQEFTIPDAPQGGGNDDADSETPEPDVCGDLTACNYGQVGDCIYADYECWDGSIVCTDSECPEEPTTETFTFEPQILGPSNDPFFPCISCNPNASENDNDCCMNNCNNSTLCYTVDGQQGILLRYDSSGGDHGFDKQNVRDLYCQNKGYDYSESFTYQEDSENYNGKYIYLETVGGDHWKISPPSQGYSRFLTSITCGRDI